MDDNIYPGIVYWYSLHTIRYHLEPVPVGFCGKCDQGSGVS